MPENIPNNIEIDIAHLEIGETFRVEDLTEVEGVDIVSNPNSTVLSILAPRLITETQEASSEEEGEEQQEESSEEKPAESDKEEGK